MTRVIVHPGLHKTGSSSLQRGLRANEAVLAPFVTLMLHKELAPARGLASRYANRPWLLRRLAFRRALRATLRGMTPAPAVVLSDERLSGLMPGNRGRVWSYRAAPALAAEVVAAVRAVWRTDDIVFLVTTRGREAWLDSAWRHNVLKSETGMSREEFMARVTPDTAPEAIVARIARRIAPVPVHTAPLEQLAAHPHGPVSAVYDLLDLPGEVRARLQPVAPQNAGITPDRARRLVAARQAEAAHQAETAP